MPCRNGRMHIELVSFGPLFSFGTSMNLRGILTCLSSMWICDYSGMGTKRRYRDTDVHDSSDFFHVQYIFVLLHRWTAHRRGMILFLQLPPSSWWFWWSIGDKELMDCNFWFLWQCRKVGEMTYMIDWYRLPSKTTLGLILTISTAQRPATITAGRLVELSLSSFCSVSYSLQYFTFASRKYFERVVKCTCDYFQVVRTSVTYLNLLRTVVL